MKREQLSWQVQATRIVAFCFLALFSLTVSLNAENIVFEAEGFDSATNWRIDNAPDASGGQFITATQHTFNDRTLVPAIYNLDVPAAGEYHLYFRAFVTAVDPVRPAGPDQNDSFFIFDGFNGVPSGGAAVTERVNELFLDVSSGGIGVEQWGWVNASAGLAVENGVAGALDSPQYTYTAAAPGPHVFNIAGREDGLYLDLFVLSTDAALTSAGLDDLVNVVPEPGCMTFVLFGLLGLAGTTRRFRQG